MNLLLTLILIPIVGIFLICNIVSYSKVIEADHIEEQLPPLGDKRRREGGKIDGTVIFPSFSPLVQEKPGSRLASFFLPLRSKQCERDPLLLVLPQAAYAKQIALIISIINLIISFIIFISF